MRCFFFIVLCVPFYFVMATKVLPCSRPAAASDNDLSTRVEIAGCEKPPCILEKGKNMNVQLKFNAREEIESLTTYVYAKVAGFPLPFIGVNGEDACNDIYDKDGKEKVPCSDIKIGQDYVYRTAIKVQNIYPEINTEVTWGLQDQNGDFVICFKVKAKIVPHVES